MQRPVEASSDPLAGRWRLTRDRAIYIAEHRPEQTPHKYGCSNWAEVFEKSGLFDVKPFSVTELRGRVIRTNPGAKNEKARG